MELGEQETTITYDKAESLVRVFSAIRRDQTKLQKAGLTPLYGSATRGYGYTVPLSRLRWRITSTTPSRRGFAARNARTNAGISGRKSL